MTSGKFYILPGCPLLHFVRLMLFWAPHSLSLLAAYSVTLSREDHCLPTRVGCDAEEAGRAEQRAGGEWCWGLYFPVCVHHQGWLDDTSSESSQCESATVCCCVTSFETQMILITILWGCDAEYWCYKVFTYCSVLPREQSRRQDLSATATGSPRRMGTIQRWLLTSLATSGQVAKTQSQFLAGDPRHKIISWLTYRKAGPWAILQKEDGKDVFSECHSLVFYWSNFGSKTVDSLGFQFIPSTIPVAAQKSRFQALCGFHSGTERTYKDLGHQRQKNC